MKTITLLRHAKSSWSQNQLADRERPLNERGERDAPYMGSRILEAGIRPSLIISSPAVRAWTTARAVATCISYPVEFLQREERLYHADVNTIIEVLQQQESAFNNILIVGHNPGFTDFANYLVPGLTSNVPTCGLVSVNFDAADWDLAAVENAELALYDFPKKPH